MACELLLQVSDGRIFGGRESRADIEEGLLLKRYWSILGGLAAGWATFKIAYCPWHLVPQSLMEWGIVLFGAAAGASGALVMILHPEEHWRLSPVEPGESE
jgi:hypothetical protein